MLPPVESTPDTPVIFDPLPDISARFHYQEHGRETVQRSLNVDRLRPKILKLKRERTLSIDSSDEETFRDGVLEKIKLDRILGKVIITQRL